MTPAAWLPGPRRPDDFPRVTAPGTDPSGLARRLAMEAEFVHPIDDYADQVRRRAVRAELDELTGRPGQATHRGASDA